MGSRIAESAEPGRVIAGQYEIRAQLGHGGLGPLSRVAARGRPGGVAFRLSPGPALPGVVEALRNVIALHERVAHLRLVRLRACGVEANRAWYVMDFVDGESLLTRVRQRGRLPANEAQRLLLQALET